MSYVSYAAPVASTGVPGVSPTPTTTAATAPVAGTQALGSPNANVATAYDPTPVTGGGAVSDFVGNAVGRLTAFAAGSMDRIQKAMEGDMTANGGQIDPARLQKYNMEMSTYEMIMQMAAKIQEKQENAAAVWLRP